jgi:hypothetical protein
MARYAIINDSNIVINIAVADGPLSDNWIPGECAKRGDTWDGENFITPEPEPEPVVLDILSTDTYNIPADGETFATVTYTSNNAEVVFSVDGDTYEVETVDQIATLEITADSPGSISITIFDKSLTIIATEVP